MSSVETGIDEDALRITELRRHRNVLDTRLYVPLSSDQLPIVYHAGYNIGFFGLERMHPFDARKWENVVNFLIDDGRLEMNQLIEPREATYSDLRVVHAHTYLQSLKCSCEVARCVEMPVVALFPCCLIERKLLKPMRLQTGGSILAAKLALDRGWAINVGGGFHHARAHSGGGFCIYADITLALKFLLIAGKIRRALIIDLDAHQGNGHERDFTDDARVYILDVFNFEIYPHDFKAKEAMNASVRLESYTGDTVYLGKLKKALDDCFRAFPHPDLVLYNAGTDTLDGDPLGQLSLSAEGIVSRDEMVFRKCINDHQAPIVMLTSGGYTRKSARVIANSIGNLFEKQLIA